MTINLKVQTQNLREKGSPIKCLATHIAGIHDDFIQITKKLDYHVKQNVSHNIADCLHLLQDNYNLVGEYGRQIMDAAEAYDKREEELHKMFEKLELETLGIDVNGTQEIEKEQSKQPKAVMATLDRNFTKFPRDPYDNQDKETSREDIKKILEQIPELHEIKYDIFSDNEQIKRIQEYIRSKGYKIMITSKLDSQTKFALVSMGIDISFLQEDSFRGDGLNLYAYVANNPINYINPSGYCKENSAGTIGRQDINRNFTGSVQNILAGGGSNIGSEKSSKLLKDLFDLYSIDTGIVDIDPQTGQVIINNNFMDDIGLSYDNRGDVTALPHGMVGTKYHLDVNTGMISYNGNVTNNYISESSRWAINHHYNLAEMKQINIDAKNKLEQLLIDRGVGDYETQMQNAYRSMHLFGNVEDVGAIPDFFISISSNAFRRYLQSKGSGIGPEIVYSFIGGLEGFVEGTGGAFSFALLGEEGVTQAEGDMFFYGLLYDVHLLELKKQYSDIRNKTINQKDYYYSNAIIENINRKREWIISMLKPIFR